MVYGEVDGQSEAVGWIGRTDEGVCASGWERKMALSRICDARERHGWPMEGYVYPFDADWL